MTAVSPSRTKKNKLLHWQPASWNEYVRVRDYYQELDSARVRLFFYENALLVDDMGWKGINHAAAFGCSFFRRIKRESDD